MAKCSTNVGTPEVGEVSISWIRPTWKSFSVLVPFVTCVVHESSAGWLAPDLCHATSAAPGLALEVSAGVPVVTPVSRPWPLKFRGLERAGPDLRAPIVRVRCPRQPSMMR